MISSVLVVMELLGVDDVRFDTTLIGLDDFRFDTTPIFVSDESIVRAFINETIHVEYP